MQNIGEEITGAYLQIEKECDFVQYNLHTPDVQGEIDVIGIDTNNKIIYVCEVAIHLITGLQYVKDRRPDNVERFVKKFEKDIDYANKYFGGYTKVYMLWSPIVKDQAPGAKYNQLEDVKEIQERLLRKKGIQLELVVNEKYLECLETLRNCARKETKELKSPVLRLMQIEEKLKKHLRSMQ